jgi:hypothetical protein
MHEIQTQSVLNPTRVGRSLRFDAQIRVKLVNRVRKNNHHTDIPNINPGTIIIAFVNQDAASTIL